MLALVSTPGQSEPVQLTEVEEPRPAADEALVALKAFGVNRGELSLLAERPGWRPGQDIAGVVIQPAASGGGPQAGARVVALEGAGWAERVAAPLVRLAELPDSVGFAAAASSAGGTEYQFEASSSFRAVWRPSARTWPTWSG